MAKLKKKQPTSTANRMNDYRARLRAAGLRPVQLWLPDTRPASFAKKVRKQCLTIAAHDPAGDEIQAFIDATYEWPPE